MEFLDYKHITFKHPFTCIVSGPSGSGKTLLIRRILQHSNLLISNLTLPIKVIWAHGQYQPLYDVPLENHNVNVKYFDGLPDENEINNFEPNIIVVDDLMQELSNSVIMEKIFTKWSHHKSISVFFLVQNLFYKSPIMRTLSTNARYFLLMKNPRDKSQIINLAKQIYPYNNKFFVEAYNDATRASYGYIKIDLTPDTPEDYRIQSRITPEENNLKFQPIVHVPENVK
jgi:hypothetical protein